MKILFAVMLIVMVSFGVVVPILPFLAKEMGASAVQMSLLVASWAFVQMLVGPVWGSLTDRYGRKRVMAFGLMGNALTFALMGMAQQYEVLLAARALGGALAAGTFLAAQALAADLSSPEHRAKAMGLVGASFGAGFLLGPTIGGVLSALGPRIPFWIAALGSLITLVLMLARIPESSSTGHASTQRLSFRQFREAAAGRGAALYWLTFLGTFTASGLFSMMGYFFIDHLRSNEIGVGIAFTVLGLGSFIAPLGVMGRLSQTRGEAWVLQAGLAASAVGFLALSGAARFDLALAAIAVTGAGIAVIRPILSALVTQRAQIGYGSALGLLSGFDALGRSVGPLWAGYSYDLGPVIPFISAGGICGICAVYVHRWAANGHGLANQQEPM